jgi:hypothetical protein
LYVGVVSSGKAAKVTGEELGYHGDGSHTRIHEKVLFVGQLMKMSQLM